MSPYRVFCLAVLTLVLLVGLGVGSCAHAVTLNGTPCEGYDSDTGTTITVSCTVGAGSRSALTVGFGVVDLANVAAHVGCTYNGDAMTQVATPAGTANQTGVVALYVLVTPDVGTANVVCTASATNTELMLVGAAWTDVNQATPTTGTDSDFDNVNPATLTPTVTGSNVGIDFLTYYDGTTNTATQSDTIIHEFEATLSNTGYSAQRGDGTLTTTFGMAGPEWAGMATALVHDGGTGQSNVPKMHNQMARLQ